MGVNRPNWTQWQLLYEAPERVVAQRLLIVQRLIRDFLAGRAGNEVRVVSICSGQGRDILGVLAGHLGRLSMSGRLVELDSTNTVEAARRAREAGLGRIEVVTRDARLPTLTPALCPPTWCSCAASSGTFRTTTCTARSTCYLSSVRATRGRSGRAIAGRATRCRSSSGSVCLHSSDEVTGSVAR
jgi:hypothetical protein